MINAIPVVAVLLVLWVGTLCYIWLPGFIPDFLHVRSLSKSEETDLKGNVCLNGEWVVRFDPIIINDVRVSVQYVHDRVCVLVCIVNLKCVGSICTKERECVYMYLNVYKEGIRLHCHLVNKFFSMQ